MNYSIEILLEQKILLEDELRFVEGKEHEETNQRYIDVCTALNKLNLPDVMPRFSHFEDEKSIIHGTVNDEEIKHEFTKDGELRWYVDYKKERIYLKAIKYWV